MINAKLISGNCLTYSESRQNLRGKTHDKGTRIC